MGIKNRIVQIASGSNIIQSAGDLAGSDDRKGPAPFRLSGRWTEKTWTPGLVRGVSFSGVGMLSCVPGKSPLLKVTTDDALLPFVNVGNSGGWLHICLDLPGVFSSIESNHLRFHLETPVIRKVNAAGAVRVALAELSENQLSLCAEGAASVFLSGTVSSCLIWASGAAHIQGTELNCHKLDVNASGASSVEITALESLAASASGAAHVIVHGTPAVQKVKIEGISEIITVEERNDRP